MSAGSLHGIASPAQGPWPSHIHAVLINNTQAAASARQVVAYEGGLNGLETVALTTDPRCRFKCSRTAESHKGEVT